MDSCLSQGYLCEVKYKQPYPVFKLGSPDLFPLTFTVEIWFFSFQKLEVPVPPLLFTNKNVVGLSLSLSLLLSLSLPLTPGSLGLKTCIEFITIAFPRNCVTYRYATLAPMAFIGFGTICWMAEALRMKIKEERKKTMWWGCLICTKNEFSIRNIIFISVLWLFDWF